MCGQCQPELGALARHARAEKLGLAAADLGRRTDGAEVQLMLGAIKGTGIGLDALQWVLTGVSA